MKAAEPSCDIRNASGRRHGVTMHATRLKPVVKGSRANAEWRFWAAHQVADLSL
jgi:hypothetical protein